MATKNYRRIAEHDKLIFDGSNNLVGIQNPNANGADLDITGLSALVSGAGNAFALSLGYNAAAVTVVASPEATPTTTIATGPDTDGNTNSQLAALRAAYTRVVTFNEAAGGVVNANKYLLMQGSIPRNTANNGVVASGEAWSGNASLYWNNGEAATDFDGLEIAIVFYVNNGASATTPVLILVDDKPIDSDTTQLLNTVSANKDRWVTLTFPSAKFRTISISGAQIKEIRWKGTSYGLYKPRARQRPAIHGDSLMAYEGMSDETPVFKNTTHLNRAGARLSRVWGLSAPPISSARGGTGFLQTNGQDGNYLQRLTLEAGDSLTPLHLIWGSTNDNGQDITAYKAQVNAFLDLSKVKFPNARRLILGPLDWASTSGAAATAVATNLPINQALYDVCAARGDTLFMPQGASLRTDAGYVYGTGKVGGTTGDGNADLYLGSAGSGTDRHWNYAAGTAYWALRAAREIRSVLLGG